MIRTFSQTPNGVTTVSEVPSAARNPYPELVPANAASSDSGEGWFRHVLSYGGVAQPPSVVQRLQLLWL